MVHGMGSGVYVAALAPLHSDLSCDYEELTKHCLDLMNRGCKDHARVICNRRRSIF